MNGPEHAPGYVPNPAYSQDDWDEVSDNPEWTETDVEAGRPAAAVLPDLAAVMRRMRGSQKRPTKKLVSLRLDPRVLDHFRATGDGWQGRINEALLKAAGLER